MAEDKNGFRRHVSAAKEWLGEAEASLDKAEEIKGDLSFMLAEAELARAKEVKRPARLRKLLPQLAALLIACLLAGGGWLLWQRTGQTEKNPREETVSSPVIQQSNINSSAGDKVRETSNKKQEAEEEFSSVADSASVEQMNTDRQEAASEQVQQTINLPPEDLQRLMSEAGRTLRAQ